MLVFVLTLIVGVFPLLTPDTPVLSSSMAYLQECPGACRPCGIYAHEYLTYSVEQDYADENVHGCVGIQWCDHAPCEFQDQDDDELMAVLPQLNLNAEELRLALLGSIPDRVRAIVEARENFVYYPDRRAIHIIGCRGDVMAHIPLTDAQVAAFDDG